MKQEIFGERDTRLSPTAPRQPLYLGISGASATSFPSSTYSMLTEGFQAARSACSPRRVPSSRSSPPHSLPRWPTGVAGKCR